MRNISVVILTVLLATCSVPPAPMTTTPGPQPIGITQPPLTTSIPTTTGIVPTKTPASTEAAPTPLPRLEGGSPIALASIHMIDPDIGWGTEKSGHIVRTRDGGNTWQDITPPQGLFNPEDFFALDANTAWSTARPSDVCDASQMVWSDYQNCMPGPQAIIWRTVDGGRTWQASEPFEAEDGHYKPIAIQFIDVNTGWFLYVSSFGPMGSTTMGMAKTDDGGLSWIHAAAPPSICVHHTMIFTDAYDGWSGADCRLTPTVGTVLQDFMNGKSAPQLSITTNGSQSWDDSPLPSPDAFPAEFISPNADPNISILCGTTDMQRLSSEAFTLQWTCSSEMGTPFFTEFSYQYLTSDHGQSWHSWLASGNEFFPNAQMGWRLYSPGEGQVSQLQQTNDGGQNWKTIKTVVWQAAHFDFISEQIGWAIVSSGDADTFLHTTDGGQNWSELKPKTVIAISPENASQITKLAIWPTNMINTLAFSPDWATIVTQAEDYSGLRLWRMDSRQPYFFMPIRQGDCGLRGTDKVMFSSDGTLLAAGLCSAKVNIWRVADGTLLQKLDGELPDGTAFSPDGSILATITYQGIAVWKVSDGTLLRTLPGELVDGVAFSPDGTILAFASQKGLQLWQVMDGTLLRTLTTDDLAFGAVTFSPDGTLLASAAKTSGLQLWQVADGALLKTLDPSEYTIVLRKVIFSPDGKLLVAARYGDDGWIFHLWQIPRGELLRTLTGVNPPLSFSPDVSQLAMGSANVIQVWGISVESTK